MALADIDDPRLISQALTEFDRLGRHAFLTRYGFAPARQYFIEHAGRLYDSKAVVGAAHQYVRSAGRPLHAADFSGGKAGAVGLLRRLGFTVLRAEVDPADPEPTAPSKAYLLTWNPTRFAWDDLQDDIEQVRAGTAEDMDWSSGNTKSIPIGSRFFLLKQGPQPRGIMGSGWTTEPVHDDDHWDPDRAQNRESANFVGVRFDTLLDPLTDQLLDPAGFPPGAAADTYWTPAASGTSISSDALGELDELWADHLALHRPTPDDDDLSALEGEERTRLIKHRRRERALRDAKIRSVLAKGPLKCEVPRCGFDFLERYGEIGRNYAHVHHVKPLSEYDHPIRTSLNDLAIVCANCHAMIHRGGVCRPMDRLIPSKGQG